MKKDIVTRKDIELLVNEFYNKVKQDKMIGFIFLDIAPVNRGKHLPVMYDFLRTYFFTPAATPVIPCNYTGM